jgi:hypothetical protein
VAAAVVVGSRKEQNYIMVLLVLLTYREYGLSLISEHWHNAV